MTEPTPNPTGEPAKEVQPQEPPKEKTFSQEQLNAAVKEEKKQWQAKMKELQAKADEWDKTQESSKSELERLQGKLKASEEALSGASLKLAKMEALLVAGVPADKVPKLMKRVSGTTPDEIAADIAEMKADGLLAVAPTAAQGAGQTVVQGGMKKTWAKSEIQKIAKTASPDVLSEIDKAVREGRVDYSR